jgi:hypothetical protein
MTTPTQTAAHVADWQPIETCPENVSVLIYIPNAEHYGPGIYRAIRVNMGTGKRWLTTAWSCGRDYTANPEPTHWMPLPKPPALANLKGAQ